MKKIRKYIIIFITMLIVLITLLIISATFPSSWIKENVKKSSDILYSEGNRKIIGYFQYDNYSDALMINTAYSIDYKNPLYSVLTAKKDYIPGITEKIYEDKVGELRFSSKYEEHDEVGELQDLVNDEAPEAFEYAKYWHGYLILLRPLLIILNYWQIRILLIVILLTLATFFILSLAQKFNKTIAFIILLGLIEIDYIFVGLNLMNSISMLIMMIFSLILLNRFEKIKDYSIVFFIIGICTGFFCLLDAPLLTFECPILVYLLMKNKTAQVFELKKRLLEILKLLFVWLLGYAFIWITKWIILDILYNRNIIVIAMYQILYRTAGIGISYKYSLFINLMYLLLPITFNVFLISIFIIKYGICKKKIKEMVPFILISLMPIVWLCVLTNHSFYHAFFVYRIGFIFLVGILLESYTLIRRKENNGK